MHKVIKMTKLKIQTNIVYKHLIKSKSKIVAQQGGTRSGKTYNILLWILFYYCLKNSNKTITICRKTLTAVRGTVMRDFLQILKSFNIYKEELHHKSANEYIFNSNRVEFISIDQPTRIRGRKRDVLFINECNNVFTSKRNVCNTSQFYILHLQWSYSCRCTFIWNF